jgi:SlyX protein
MVAPPRPAADGLNRMPNIEALSARVEALEMRIAHQDRMLDDLNATVTAQWKQIENFNRQIARLDQELQDARSSAGPAGENEPPPHY